MAVHARCPRRADCNFKFDDAEHMEDAAAKMRAHFRLEHPTKAFYERSFFENTEAYNATVDEVITGYTGFPDWRNQADPQQITHACQSACRYWEDYPKETIDALREIAREHGREIPDPFDQANAAPGGGIPPGGPGLVDFIAEVAPPRFVDRP